MKRVFLLVVMVAGTLTSAKAQLSVGTNPATPAANSNPLNLQIRATNGKVVGVEQGDGTLNVEGKTKLGGFVTASDTIKAKEIKIDEGLKVVGTSHLVGKVTASGEVETQQFLTAKGGVVIHAIPNNNSLTVDGPSHLKAGVLVEGHVNAKTLQVTSGAQPGYFLRSDAAGVATWSAFTGQPSNAQTSDIWVYGKIDSATPRQWITSGGANDGSKGSTTNISFDIVADAFGNWNKDQSFIEIRSDGIYQMSAAIRKSTASVVSNAVQTPVDLFNMGFYVVVNGTLHSRFFHDGFQGTASMPLASGAMTLALKAGDHVQFALFSSFGEYGVGGKAGDTIGGAKTVAGEGFLTFIKLSNIPKP